MKEISYAYGQNHFTDDAHLQAVLRHYWRDYPQHEHTLSAFGDYAGTDIYETVYHVDHDAHPVLINHDLDGNRVDRVRISPAQRAALRGIAHINRPPYEGGSWHHHFAQGYLVADPGLYCVLTITGQTIYAIHKYAPRFAAWKEQMLAGEAFGATWMTESQGGSDLGANLATARKDGELWRLTADKYFASGAGLTDYAITTARPESGKAGPKGLALFLLPRLNRSGDLNYHVRRLKDKSATRAVPSGEVELMDSEAYLIGRAEEGIYYTLENLTVSRLANAVASMGIGRKAQLEVLGRVGRRRTFGQRLSEHPLIRRDLTDLSVRLAGGLALSFHAVHQFDSAWHARPPYTPEYHYARFLSHVAKNRTANHVAAMTAMAMELFGGLGFLEEYAVARWHREALITPIWEGASNIQALDFLETLQKQKAHEAFLAEVLPMLDRAGTREAKLAAERVIQTFAHLATLDGPAAQWHAKHALQIVADATQAALLYNLAETQGETYEKLAELYVQRFLEHQEYPDWVMTDVSVWGVGITNA